MKLRLIALMLALVLTASLAACGSGSSYGGSSGKRPEILPAPVTEDPEPEEDRQIYDMTEPPALDREALYQEAARLMYENREMEAAKILIHMLDYEDCRVRMEEIVFRGIWYNRSTFSYFAAVHEDGGVVNDWYDELDSSGMGGIISIACGYGTIAGLREDGSVHVCGDVDEEVRREVANWENVIGVLWCDSDLVGLTAYGTVLSTDPDSPVRGWSDIVKLRNSYGTLVGVRLDGTVVCNSDYYNVSGWTDVVDVAVGLDGIVALRSDGTVLADGFTDQSRMNMSQWTDVVAVDAYQTAMALRSDGTVLIDDAVFGDWFAEEIPDVSGWSNVVAIDTWGFTYMGLRSDGTLLAAGMDEGGQLNVGHWRNVEAVVVDNYTTAALCSDGTVLRTGGENEVLFTGIQVPEDGTW